MLDSTLPGICFNCSGLFSPSSYEIFFWPFWNETSVAGYVFEGPRKGPLDIGAYGDNTLRPLFKELGLTWRGFHSGRRSGVTEMRAYGKSEDVSFHFGHSVAIANALYDAGRIEATRKAALSYANSLQETNERQN